MLIGVTLVRVGCSRWWPGIWTGVVFSSALKTAVCELVGSGSAISQAIEAQLFSL